MTSVIASEAKQSNLNMKKKRIILIILLLITALAFVSCRSEEHFGRRKAPKDCNCTRF